jgi:sugar phosphate permease
MSTAIPTQRPQQLTRVRYRVVTLTTLLAMVTYLDRVSISTLAPMIQRDLGLSTIQMSYVFSAFALAYALFEIPTAWWADRAGTRQVLARIVLWWSAFTAASAAAFNFTSMLVVRFLFGAGEAGAWPCAARALSRWIPASERGTVQGIFFAGAHLMGGLTPVIILNLMLPFMGWRAVFLVLGCVGLIWVWAWYRWFRDDPREHPDVGQPELDRILAERPPDSPHVTGWAYWGALLRNRNVLALCVMYAANSTIFYFCITWLPTYLNQRHGFDFATLGLFAGLPLLLSVIPDVTGGLVTDRLSARFGVLIGRRVVGIAGYVVAGACLIAAGMSPAPMTAALLIAVATASAMFTLGAAWGACIEMGRNHVAVVGATMNTAGQVASLLCPLVVGYSVQWFNDWDLPLHLIGVFFLVGALCWLIIDPRKPVFAD